MNGATDRRGTETEEELDNRGAERRPACVHHPGDSGSAPAKLLLDGVLSTRHKGLPIDYRSGSVSALSYPERGPLGGPAVGRLLADSLLE
mmetsp:Transcript_509/g.1025  ORF Transcript_509/g.1025 Transcript_509/m.1025 type:complete len:90 (-) Transcript_509:830-1099(-)